MNQDFHDYYSTLPTVELLQIQAEKEKYQSEAIEALEAVLQSRTVTSEEQQLLEQKLSSTRQKEDLEQKRKETIKDFIRKAHNVLSPTTEKNIRQQVVLLCIIMSIGILSRLILDARYFILVIKGGYSLNFYTVFMAGELIVDIAMITLLLQHQRAGWTIATVVYIFSFMIAVYNALHRIEMQSRFSFYSSYASAKMIWAVLITGGILYYLNTAKLMVFFEVSKKWRATTVIAPALIVLLYLLTLMLSS